MEVYMPRWPTKFDIYLNENNGTNKYFELTVFIFWKTIVSKNDVLEDK